jgi:hypothetical protein
LTVADPSDGTIQFKSMPYFSQFPASPSMPVFVNASSTSITVAWDKPHRIGGSSLKGYQVFEYTILKKIGSAHKLHMQGNENGLHCCYIIGSVQRPNTEKGIKNCPK